MKKSRLGRIRGVPYQYERMIDMVTKGVGVCKFSDAPNAKYGARNLVGCILEAATGKGNMACAAEARREAQEATCTAVADMPSGEWVRLAMRGVTPGMAVGALYAQICYVLAEMRRVGKIDDELDVAIDFHNIRRFDKKPGPELVRGGDKASKSKAFYETYCTIQCLVDGQRLTLGMFPYTSADSHAVAVRALLASCREHGVRLGKVMMDREFFSQSMVSLLQESGVKWLMPCPNTPYVIRALADFEAGRRERASDAVITSSGGLKCPYTMVVTERRSGSKKDDWRKEPHEKYIAFATNDPGIDVDKYSKRWGIETNYRMLESMRVKTRSTGHGPRVMCMAITIMLFNAWVLVGALAGLPGDAARAGRPIRLHSALVAMAVLVWYPDTGPGPPPIAP